MRHWTRHVAAIFRRHVAAKIHHPAAKWSECFRYTHTHRITESFHQRDYNSLTFPHVSSIKCLCRILFYSLVKLMTEIIDFLSRSISCLILAAYNYLIEVRVAGLGGVPKQYHTAFYLTINRSGRCEPSRSVQHCEHITYQP